MFLLGGAAAAWTIDALAQQQKAMPVIGFLGGNSPGPSAPSLAAFRQGLSEIGYVEGHNLTIEYRWAEGHFDRLPAMAADLVGQKVDIIVASGSQAVRAAQQATQSTPIAMTGSSDPVGTGLVASLARPGGNITGLSLQTPEVSGKRLELLVEIVPGLSRAAVLLNPDDPPALLALKETEVAARTLGMKLQAGEVRRPDDFDAAFTSAAAVRPEALVILAAPLLSAHAGRIAEWAVKNGLPSIFPFRGFPEAGGLMSYGPDLNDNFRRAATYVDKILKGAKPGDLPVEQPTKFELVINLKTAKALGLTVPQSILARADELIE
jgi:putative ABC transport system substrate-binding protein